MSYIEENFENLQELAHCIAETFGKNCEVVIHDWSRPYESTIVAIENGHVTGRKVGDSGTNSGLEIMRGMNGKSNNYDEYNSINTTKTGHIVRSSSKYFKDKDGKIAGSMCINYDITELIQAQKSIQELVGMDHNRNNREIFANNVDDLLNSLLQDVLTQTNKTVSNMTKEDKVKAIRYLDQHGAFLIKKSVEKVSEFFSISKFTLYNYLEEGKEVL